MIISHVTRAAVTIRNYSNSNALWRTIFRHIPMISTPVSTPLFAMLTKLYILNNNDCVQTPVQTQSNTTIHELWETNRSIFINHAPVTNFRECFMKKKEKENTWKFFVILFGKWSHYQMWNEKKDKREQSFNNLKYIIISYSSFIFKSKLSKICFYLQIYNKFLEHGQHLQLHNPLFVTRDLRFVSSSERKRGSKIRNRMAKDS